MSPRTVAPAEPSQPEPASPPAGLVRLGTAGWSIPREVADRFPGEGRHLARYGRVMGCAEINSSFHREHRREQYARWAAEVPDGFLFSVKVPRTITHEGRLRAVREPLQRFLDQAGGLGDRLGVLLVQLPPSFAFEARPVRTCLALLEELAPGVRTAWEPRHPTWFTPEADAMLAAARAARVAADPARVPEAAVPGGWGGDVAPMPGGARTASDPVPLRYYRWHGAPRMYWSRYEDDWLLRQADAIASSPGAAETWCIFDNTAGSGALPNALTLGEALVARGRAPSP